MRIILAAVLAMAAGTSAAAQGVIEQVESPVYEAPGTPAALARKAAVCMGRILKPGLTTAPTIIAQDIDGGTVVANAAFEFAEKSKGVRFGYQGRAKVTFEAKQDRFRLTSSDVEMLIRNRGWTIVPRQPAPKPLYADAVLTDLAGQVAACVKAPPPNW